MMQHEPDNLEKQVAGLTEWQGDKTELWKSALQEVDATPRTLNWPWQRMAGIAALIVISFVVVVAALQPNIGKARDQARMPFVAETDSFQHGSEAPPIRDGYGGGMTGRAPAAPPPVPASSAGHNDMRRLQDLDPTRLDTDGNAARHVVRKATIELVTADVRSTFMKVSMLISDAHGEFIEESSLTGDDDVGNASIVLRVRADRLSNVLNDLRTLGEVREESLRGDDVTSQVVDINARLRNEQRIETELLELLDSRNDAPLDDVLQVRRELQNVRQRIEQLIARRDHLSRLVSLATVLVLIHKADQPEPEVEPVDESLGAYFSESIGNAWHDGVRGLVNAISFLVEVIIGGIIWWVTAVAALIAAWRLLRRQHAQTV